MWNRVRTILLRFQLIFCLLISASSGAVAAGPDALWAAVREGSAFVVMRHALAPGTGDPEAFDVSNCATQRNLSDAGRRQAMQIGDRLRANGVAQAAVFSSAWCRCLDTARLLDVGPVETLAPLNSFFRNWQSRDPQMAALTSWLSSHKPTSPLILVTHQVNVTALTGVYPKSGDMIVVRRQADGRFIVLGEL